MKPVLCRRVFLALFSLLVLLAPAATRAALQEGDFKQWGLLAVQDEGRRKPLDTFAHDALLRITGGSFMGMDVYKDTAGRVWRPNDFLLSILSADGHDWKKEPLVLVNYRPLVQRLGLDARAEAFFLRGTLRPARFHRSGPRHSRSADRRTRCATRPASSRRSKTSSVG